MFPTPDQSRTGPSFNTDGGRRQETEIPLILHVQGDDNLLIDDQNFSQDQAISGYRFKVVLITQWVFVAIFALLIISLLISFPPWKPEYKKNDIFQTCWAIVWSTLTLTQMLLLVAMTHIRRLGLRVPKMFFHVQRVIRSLNTIWFVCGIKPLFWDPPYDEEAVRLARSLWLTQAGFFLIPLFIYLMVCLCMPCILIFLNRMRGPNLNATPTPEWILSKLEVKKYGDLLENLRRDFGAQQVELTSPANLLQDALHTNPIVEALTSATATGGIMRGGAPDRNGVTNMGGGVHRLKLEKSCPICMTDFERTEDVMVMPCDKRHFFHVDCVKQWLQGSQYCPICRANVVTLTSAENATSVNAHDSLPNAEQGDSGNAINISLV